jgi:hypothetical protein
VQFKFLYKKLDANYPSFIPKIEQIFSTIKLIHLGNKWVGGIKYKMNVGWVEA